MIEWGRLITAMVTPFNENMEVDYEQVVILAQKLVEDGNTALVICGTTAEAPTLSNEEKNKLIRTVKENVNVPIIAGVGTNSTEKTVESAKAALAAGADGLLVVVPYYNKPDQNSIFEHFKTVAESVDAKIMLYNVPGRTGVNMLPETVRRLADMENIVALKEACGDVNQISQIVNMVGDRISVYSGDDSLTLPSLSVGAYGIVSVAGHIVSRKMNDMIMNHLEGRNDKAVEIHKELSEIFKGLFVMPNPVPVKAALNLMGMTVGGVRMPLMPATSELESQIRSQLTDLGLLEEKEGAYNV